MDTATQSGRIGKVERDQRGPRFIAQEQAQIDRLRADVARLAKWQARAEYLMIENPNAYASEILALLKLEK